MSSHLILRALSSKGGHGILLSNFVRKSAAPDICKTLLSKKISCSPALASFIEPARGPYTPEDKRGKSHMMMASTHWKVERVVAVSMVGILPACLFIQHPVMNYAMSLTVLAHGFWGVDGVMYDYIDKWLGNSKLHHWIWYAITMLAFAGLINFNYNDVGVQKAVQMLWAL